MNKYGEQLCSHYQRWLPERYASLEDPEGHFTLIGRQMADDVQRIADRIAGPDVAGETYMEKVGRLNTARLQAEEIVRAEMVPAPESEEDEGAEDAALHFDSVRIMRETAEEERRLEEEELGMIPRAERPEDAPSGGPPDR